MITACCNAHVFRGSPTSTAQRHILVQTHDRRSLGCVPNLDIPTHLTEEVHDTGEDNQQDTTTGSQPEHLGQETFVKRTEAFLLHDGAESGPRPVVLGHLSDDLGGVLDTRLDDVHGGVENSTDGATDGTGHKVVGDLALLSGGGGQKGADLEDAAEVASVPEDVAPHGGLETLVQREGPLLPHDLGEAVHHAVVLVSLGSVLQTDLDELEGNDDEGFGGTGGGAGEDGKGLVHLLLAEEVAVEGTPGIVCGEFGGPVCFRTGG